LKKEDFFIKAFLNDLNGDDGAFVDGFVYSKDLFCEDIHFKREWMSLYQIVKKALLINISDAIVMNAKPKYLLLGIKLPKDISKDELIQLQNAFLIETKKWGIKIIGGDTIAGERLDISITLISKTKKPVFRSGIKKGDLIAFTGKLGSVKRDLKRAFIGSKLSIKSKFLTPSLKPKFFYEISKHINAAIDISDG